MRTFAVLLFVSATLVACQDLVPETVFAEGVTGETGSISGAPVAAEPSIDATLAKLNKGGTGPEDGSDIAVSGPTSQHAVVKCSAGETICSNGECASVCPEPQLTDQGNGGSYNVNFQPTEQILAKPANVAGTPDQFTKLATNHANERTRITNLAIQNAEEAAGLTGASDHEAAQMKTQKLAAEKQEVDEFMNKAAAAAASYKAADAAHTAATVAVAQAKKAEDAQAAIVAEAKATLENQKKILAEKKVMLRKARESKNSALYHAEDTARVYEDLKAQAIAKDNHLQQQIEQEKQKIHFREVAEAAVEKAAAEDLKKQEAQAAADLQGKNKKSAETKIPSKPPATEAAQPAAGKKVNAALAKHIAKPTCSDCQDKVVNGKTVSGLPAVYAKAKGFCSDCAEWKQAGQCEDPKYKTFMAHYCQKSCGCKDYAAKATTTKAPTELHQMPTVKGLME